MWFLEVQTLSYRIRTALCFVLLTTVAECVCVCVCVDALMGFRPGQRVLMGLILGKRKRRRVAVCSTIRKTERDVSTASCFSQHFEHARTHTVTARRGVPPSYI